MTTKEKAEELVNKYKPFVYCYSGSGMLINQEDEGVILNNAKQCASFAVDEILKEYSVLQIETSFCYKYWKYWQEVKNEINNL